MKGYWVCIYENIYDKDKLKEYAIKAKPAIEKFSGIFLVRGGKNKTTEGMNTPRIVVVEFPNFNTAVECYNSADYQEAHNILSGHVKRHHQIVESI